MNCPVRILPPSPPWPMPMAHPPSPPDPPNLPGHVSRVTMDNGMDLEDASQTRLPVKPTTNPPSSLFLTFLAGIIGNPEDQLVDGAVKIDPNSLGIIHRMMEAKATRLLHLEKRVAALESFETRLIALEENHLPPQPTTRTVTKLYAKAIGPSTSPTPPTATPPP
ncbi:uncharacterized protein VP01_5311g1 [Puccinia sorghi]|uniref:Uncharacterized protein n=1 Tax=Puccinia sorghi TaxID=27349 RepID=A0A0L6UK99_9BASI|nr:uncharacterized protein VP01_5311g1 [Puccinia sorghi]